MSTKTAEELKKCLQETKVCHVRTCRFCGTQHDLPSRWQVVVGIDGGESHPG